MSRHALLVLGLLVFGCDVRSPPAELDPRPGRVSRAPHAEARAAREAPAIEPAPVAAAPAQPDRRLEQGFELRAAIRDGRIALVPIVATGPIASEPILTLREGMTRGSVTVREARDGFDVEHVWLTNRSDQALVVLNGEVIIEAHQDRVMAESLVVMPGEAREVRVRCVEAARAEGGSRFRASGAIAELPLRRVVAHQGQREVWAKVDEINARLGLGPTTRTYRHAAALQAVGGPAAEQRARLAAQLAAHPDRARMVGVAVTIDGRALALDRFVTPDLYQRYEAALLASYVAGEAGPRREGRAATPDDIRALIRQPGAFAMTDAWLGALQPPDPVE
jgi:hypothetical protein